MTEAEARSIAASVGILAAILSLGFPAVAAYVLWRWAVRSRLAFAVRSALVPLALMTTALGGPAANMLLGQSEALGFGRLRTRLLGILVLWLLTGPIALVLGWTFAPMKWRMLRVPTPSAPDGLVKQSSSTNAIKSAQPIVAEVPRFLISENRASMPGSASGEGIRRLAHAVGALVTFGWFVIVLISSDFFQASAHPGVWAISTLLLPIAYGLGWISVHGIAWVREGFAHDRRA